MTALISVSTAVLLWRPERDEAQRLLEEELADERYRAAEPNPIATWLADRFAELMQWLNGLGQGASGFPGWVLLVLLVAAAVVILFLVRPRGNTRGRRREREVLPDRMLSPEDHRAQARAAAARGDHGAALVAWFRATVRQAEVRTLLDERPGRTATEAAWALAQRAPAEQQRLLEVADRFNAVLYDHAEATAEQAELARTVEAALAELPSPMGAS